jgi:hypothetical protein
MTTIIRAGVALDLGAEPRDPDTALSVSGMLFAETDDGRRLLADGGAVGVVFGGGRSDVVDGRARRRDVEGAVDAMLGRDPRQRPPHLAWDQLRNVLAREVVDLTDDELIAMPFAFEFSDALMAELRD